MDFIKKAELVCKIAHKAVGQKRKYTGEDYHYHPIEVAQIVRTTSGCTPEMVVAALLHDVVEDTHLTVEDIAQEFGNVVAGMVYELTDQFTDPTYGNRSKRKQAEAERLANVSGRAQTIKYADLIHNTRTIIEHDLGFAVVYLPEKRRLLEGMTDGDPTLRQLAFKFLEDAEASVRKLLRERRAQTHVVYINERHVRTVYSADEAWEVIDRQPLGSRHVVYDADDNIRPEFVPF